MRIGQRERLIRGDQGKRRPPVSEWTVAMSVSEWEVQKTPKAAEAGGSTTKHEIFYILGKEWRKDLQEGKFQQKSQTLLCGEPRVIKDPGVLLDHREKVFFIFGGEMLPGQEVDVFVIGMIKVGHIHGNEEGDH